MSSEYQATRQQLYRLDGEGKYKEGLELALEAKAAFPDRPAWTSFMTATFYSRLGQNDRAIETLREALKKGSWWSKSSFEYARLDSLVSRSDFKEILKECEKRKESASKRELKLNVFTPVNYSKENRFPLLIAMHGRGQALSDVSLAWKNAIKSGVIVAALQSSQVYDAEGFCWDDVQQTESDLTNAFSQIKKSYSVDESKVLLGGFSQGGGWAAYATFRSKPIRSRGFIGVAPAPRGLAGEKPDSLKAKAQVPKVKGVIFAGKEDHILDQAEELYEDVQKAGVPCRIRIDTGLGHEYPPDFNQQVQESIKFILE